MFLLDTFDYNNWLENEEPADKTWKRDKEECNMPPLEGDKEESDIPTLKGDEEKSDMPPLEEDEDEVKEWNVLKILTPNIFLARLPILFAGNN